MFRYQAAFDSLRSITSAGISGTYAAIGTALTNEAVVLTFKNQTNGDVVITTNISQDMLFFPSNSYGVYDIRTNAPFNTDLFFAKGTQFFAKDGTTPSSSGTFYIEAVILTDLPSNTVS